MLYLMHGIMLVFNKCRWLFMLLTLASILLTKIYALAQGKVVAMVNGKAITLDAVMAEVNKKLPQASYHSQVSKQKLRELQGEALQELIEEELLYQEAQRQKIKIAQSELERQVAMMKRDFSSGADFQRALASAGLSLRLLKARLERRFLIKKIYQKEILEKVKVTDSDLRAYFEENRTKFVIPKQFLVRHILISVKPGAMVAGWQAGLKKAQEVYSRLMAGEDFVQLARQVSADSSSRELGGYLGWLHKGQLIPELDKVVTKMKVGEISKPIRSIYGFHILKLEAERPRKQLSFDEINHQKLKKKLMNKRIRARLQEYLAKLKAKSDIRIFEF